MEARKDVERAAALTAERMSAASAESTQDDHGSHAENEGGLYDWTEPFRAADAEQELSAGLTESEAVRLALRANAGLRAMVEEIAAARADVAQAGLLPNPVVSVSVGFPFRDSPGTMVSASLMQQLAAIWTRSSRIEGAEAELDASVIGVSGEAVRVASAARRLWHRTVWAQREVMALEHRAAWMEERAEYVTRAWEVGETSEAERIEAAAEAGMARDMALEAEHRVRDTQEELARVIGLGGAGARVRPEVPQEPFSVDTEWLRAVDPLWTRSDHAEAMERAMTWRLDVALADARARAAAARARLAGLEGVPEIEAGPMWDRDFDGIENLGFGLGVEVPVFDDGSAARANAAAMLRVALLRAIDTRQTVRAEVAQAWHAWEIAARRVEVFAERVERNLRLGVDAAERTGQAGLADAGDVAMARAAWAESAARLAELRREEAEAKVDLDEAVGGWQAESGGR